MTGFTPTAGRLMPELTPRQELALLARALWREGYDDHLAGHITADLGDGTLLCNPWLLTWAEVRPEHVLRITVEGEVVEGEWPVPLGIPLHLELHKRHPDIGWAAHSHPRFGTVWADLAELPPILDQSSALGGGRLVLVDEYSGPVDDAGSAARAVEAMGDATSALLAGHGVLVIGQLGPGGAPAGRGPRTTVPSRLARPGRRRPRRHRAAGLLPRAPGRQRR